MEKHKGENGGRAADFSARVVIAALSAAVFGLVLLSASQYCQLYRLSARLDTLYLHLGSQDYDRVGVQAPRPSHEDSVVYNGTQAGASSKSERTVAKRSTDSGCGGDIILNHLLDKQKLTSPNYPEPYGSNMDCVWVIQFDQYPTPQAYAGSMETDLTKLEMVFDGPIDLEASLDCQYDYLEIRAGFEDGVLLEKFCGPQNDTRKIIRSGVTTPLFVKFHSDHGVGKKGFSATLSVTTSRLFFPAADLPGTNHAVFTRWGRSTCSAGKAIYEGYVAGYQEVKVEGQPVLPQKLQCIPLPLDMTHNDTEVSKAARLALAGFNLRGNNEVFENRVDRRLIRCALCDTIGDEQFTVIGWNECHSSKWITAYSGYLMADVSRHGQATSDPICVDQFPEGTQEAAQSSNGLQVNFVASGNGFWYENKPIPCAVCIREEATP